jgi:hypothetical protein
VTILFFFVKIVFFPPIQCTRTYIYICTHMHICVCLYILSLLTHLYFADFLSPNCLRRARACTHTHTYTHTYTHTHTHFINRHTYMSVHTYTYTFFFTLSHLIELTSKFY